MACYRCGERQLEPGRGSEPWQQGVIGDRQVLICPACQSAGDWRAELDRCAVCRSVQLYRRLGEVECCDCGATGAGVRPRGDTAPAARPAASPYRQPAGLAAEVEQALARVLNRAPAGDRESARPGVTG